MITYTIRDIREYIKDGLLTEEVFYTFIKEFAIDFNKLNDWEIQGFKHQVQDGTDYLGLNLLKIQQFFDENKGE